MAYIEDLVVEIPFQYLAVEKMKLVQHAGQHAYGELELLLEEEGTKVIEKLDASTVVGIKVKGQILFKGIPLKTDVETVNQVNVLKMELVSCSFLMDIKKKKRSFQNPEQTYSELFEDIAREYQGGILEHGVANQPKSASLIQYQETDWAFLNRVASLLNTVLYPDVRFATPKLYLGTQPGRVHHVDNINYTIKKDLKTFQIIKTANLEWEEDYELSYQIETMDSFSLGDKVNYAGTMLTIYEKRTELLDSTIFHRYSLKIEAGIGVIPHFNQQLKGLSVVGTVLAVKDDQLKVHLEIDEQQEEGTAFWYSFETPYSNEGYTGWYCMPQVGDQVNLYIAGGDERGAYVRNVNRSDSHDERIQNPSNKCFATVHGNEMSLTPTDVTFSQIPGKLYLKMHQNQGVELISNESISLDTGEVGIECESIELISNDKIVVGTGGAGMIVDKIVHLKGL